MPTKADDEWITVWRPGAKRLSERAIDRLLANCTNNDYPQTDKPLEILAYPAISFGATRVDASGVASGTGVLYPCCHPIRIKGRNIQWLNYIMGGGLPIHCSYCVKEANEE